MVHVVWRFMSNEHKAFGMICSIYIYDTSNDAYFCANYRLQKILQTVRSALEKKTTAYFKATLILDRAHAVFTATAEIDREIANCTDDLGRQVSGLSSLYWNFYSHRYPYNSNLN